MDFSHIFFVLTENTHSRSVCILSNPFGLNLLKFFGRSCVKNTHTGTLTKYTQTGMTVHTTVAALQLCEAPQNQLILLLLAV